METKSTREVTPETPEHTDSSRKSSVERTTAVFTSGNLIATGLRLISGVLTSRFVDPSVLGLFNGIGLVKGYVPLLLLGVNNGLNRELPYHVGRGDKERVSLLASAAQAWSLIVGAVAGIGMLVIAFYHVGNQRWQLSAGWGTFAVVVFMVVFGDIFLMALFRSCGRFVPLAKLSVLRAALRGVMVLLVWRFGFYGLCLREFTLALFVLAFLWCLRPLRERPRLSKKGILQLGKTGGPIFIVGQLYKLWGVLNATMVLKLCGTTGLGLFVIANLVGPTIAMVPQSLSQVAYPRMSEEYGKTGNIRSLVHLVRRPVAYAVVSTALLVAVTWFALPPLVGYVLPKYSEGILAGQWAALSTVVLAIAPFNDIFNVIKRQKIYAGSMIIGIVGYFVALLLLTHRQVYLAAFPQAMLIGRVVFLGVSLSIIRHFVRRERRMEAVRPEKARSDLES
jgi:O-antigen/teichoic acid export membrane protein